MGLEAYYVVIPVVLFAFSFVARCFIDPGGYWEKINVGRTLCLESISMAAIAYLHMTIEKLKCDILVKKISKTVIKPETIGNILTSIKMEKDIVIGICIVIVFLYGILSLSEKHMNEMDQYTRLRRKFRDEEESYSRGYYWHVIISLLIGISSLLIIILIYTYTGPNFSQAVCEFFWEIGIKVYGATLCLILLALLIIRHSSGTLQSRSWRRKLPAIDARRGGVSNGE